VTDHRSTSGLPVRRGRVADRGPIQGVLVDIDPTIDDEALEVVHTALEEPPSGHRVVFGYDVVAVGLGAWVGDRRVQVQLWPALVDEDGEVIDIDGLGRLRIDFDPAADRALLDDLADRGRLIVAGPDIGPVPLVVDLDTTLVAEVVASVDRA
jgi:hypothetical protein